jgi:glutamyl-Q tRNA(Asp) synthetase
LLPGQAARAWRVRVDDAPVCLHDRILGERCQPLANEVGDFIIKRADGLFAYQLAVVVDDAFQGITHIVRGADLLWNTPRQVYVQRLLGLATPVYAHVPLMTNAAGQKLAKQTYAPALPMHGQSAVLTQALTALGHPPPADLHGAAPTELLNWAITCWRIDRVPTHPVIANIAPRPDNSLLPHA